MEDLSVAARTPIAARHLRRIFNLAAAALEAHPVALRRSVNDECNEELRARLREMLDKIQ